jgi:two-component system response regulator RpaA
MVDLAQAPNNPPSSFLGRLAAAAGVGDSKARPSTPTAPKQPSMPMTPRQQPSMPTSPDRPARPPGGAPPRKISTKLAALGGALVNGKVLPKAGFPKAEAPGGSPSIAGPGAAPNRAPAVVEPRPTVSPGGSAKALMIVEDDPSIREMLVRALGLTYSVFEAPDGEAALDMMGRMRALPELVIMDIMMPKMDGLTLANKMKKDPKLWGLPIIMLTGRDSPKDIVQGINMGARHYLTKPFKIQDLLDRITKTIAAKKR